VAVDSRVLDGTLDSDPLACHRGLDSRGPKPWILLHLGDLGLVEGVKLTMVLHACICAVQEAGIPQLQCFWRAFRGSAQEGRTFMYMSVVWRQYKPRQVFTQHGGCLLGLAELRSGWTRLDFASFALWHSSLARAGHMHGVCTLRIVTNSVGGAWTHLKLKAAVTQVPGHPAFACDRVPVRLLCHAVLPRLDNVCYIPLLRRCFGSLLVVGLCVVYVAVGAKLQT
jgi:hypothetical protein